MSKLVVICTCLLVALNLQAQQPTPPPAPPQYGWTHSLVSGLTLTQVALKDWEQGGESALAYTALIQGKSISDEPSTNWTATYDLAFGQAQLGDKGLRKTFDKIVVRNTTGITAKVSKYVTVLLGMQVINEPKVSPRTQIKESLALGLSYTIL